METKSKVQTTADLREILLTEIERLRSGVSKAPEANAMARLVKEISGTFKIELEAKKLTMRMAEGDQAALPAPLSLGPQATPN